jgi:RNA polymerase sigma factor (sigma-70 family)
LTTLFPHPDKGTGKSEAKMKMAESAPSFEELLTRMQAGDGAVIGTLFTQYSDSVRRVVRRLLHARLRRRYDSADFVQSVWASFVDLPQADYSFGTPEELVAFLSRIAYNKVVRTTRQRLGTEKHDMRREQSLDSPGRNEAPLATTLPGASHTPSQYVMADERWEKIIQGLPPGHVRVLELLRDGHSHVEIIDDLGVPRKVIQRLLHRLRHFMDKE